MNFFSSTVNAYFRISAGILIGFSPSLLCIFSSRLLEPHILPIYGRFSPFRSESAGAVSPAFTPCAELKFYASASNKFAPHFTLPQTRNLSRPKSGQVFDSEQRHSSNLRTARNASVGSCTLPRERIFFLPSFCFSSSFFLRLISPP